MTIKSQVLTALSAVLTNTWAIELPEQPTWPAIVFDIDSELEQNWVQDGGYDQHTVGVVILAKTLGEIPALQTTVDVALMAIPVYLREEGRGDAAYEPDPSVYACFSNHVIRTRRT